jgi:transposase-like protein
MTTKRKRHSADFKAKIALEAVRGVNTLAELSSQHGVHAKQISEWKRQLLAGIRDIFATRRCKEDRDQQAVQANSYEEIGRLKVELEWSKKYFRN